MEGSEGEKTVAETKPKPPLCIFYINLLLILTLTLSHRPLSVSNFLLQLCFIKTQLLLFRLFQLSPSVLFIKL